MYATFWDISDLLSFLLINGTSYQFKKHHLLFCLSMLIRRFLKETNLIIIVKYTCINVLTDEARSSQHFDKTC